MGIAIQSADVSRSLSGRAAPLGRNPDFSPVTRAKPALIREVEKRSRIPASTEIAQRGPQPHRNDDAARRAQPGLSAPARQEAITATPESHEGSEIVYVIRDFQLLDPESYQRSYRRHDAQALAKGYYIVSWPQGKDTGTYSEDTSFVGPFKQRKDAETHLREFQHRPRLYPQAIASPR